MRDDLRASRKLHGARHSDSLVALSNLAGVLTAQKRYDEAEPLMQQNLALCRQVHGSLHPHTLTAISNLVHLFRQMGCTHEAEPLLREESEISARTLGPRHPDTLRATESLGSLLTHLGRLPEALAIISRLHGQSHMWTLSLLTKLTSQLYREGKYAEAEPYARQLVRATR